MTLITKRDRRIRRLAGVLCVEWVSGQTWVDKYNGRWWLVGCPGGDHPLPNTGGCHTVDEALDAAEAWLAPQIDLPECSICRRRHGPEVGLRNSCERYRCPRAGGRPKGRKVTEAEAKKYWSQQATGPVEAPVESEKPAPTLTYRAANALLKWQDDAGSIWDD